MISSEETEVAQRLIARYRRFAVQWKVLRWIVLLAALCCLGVAVLGYSQMERLASFSATVQPVTGQEMAGNVGAVLDARISLLRAELRIYVALVIFGTLGGLLLIVTLIGWNRYGSFMSLKAKLIETVVSK